MTTKLDGRPGPTAFLADDARLGDALIGLHAAGGAPPYPASAGEPADALRDRVWDDRAGMCVATGRNHPVLVMLARVIGATTHHRRVHQQRPPRASAGSTSWHKRPQW
jgi:uncharacterized protein YyaL (SSP411 family)